MKVKLPTQKAKKSKKRKVTHKAAQDSAAKKLTSIYTNSSNWIHIFEMLSSLDALAGKISPGSGKNSPNQQYQGVDNNNTTTATTTTTTTSSTKSNHFNQNIHPYQKLDHNSNREK